MNFPRTFLFLWSTVCATICVWILFKQVLCRLYNALDEYEGAAFKILFIVSPIVISIVAFLFLFLNRVPAFAEMDRTIPFLLTAGVIWACVHAFWCFRLFLLRSGEERIWDSIIHWTTCCWSLLEGKPLFELDNPEPDNFRDWAVAIGACLTLLAFAYMCRP